MLHQRHGRFAVRSGGWSLYLLVACATGALLGGCVDVASPPTPDAAPEPEVPAVWGADRALTVADGDALTTFNFARAIAVTEDDAVHSVWYATQAGTAQIRYARSLDGGESWLPPINLAPSASPQGNPAIATEGSNVHIAWHEQRVNGMYVVITSSLDTGLTWQTARTLSAGQASAMPSVAVAGDTVHVTWFDNSAGVSEVAYSRSVTAGAWSIPIHLSSAGSDSWVSGVNAGGDQVIVSWVDYRDSNEEEYLRISNDRGATWRDITRMTNDGGDSWAPSVAIVGDTVHFAWFDRRDAPFTDIEVETEIDEVAALVGIQVPPIPARDPNHYYLFDFTARLDQKLAAVQAAAPGWVAQGGDPDVLQTRLQTYEDHYLQWTTSWDVYYKRSIDGGLTFGPDRRLTTAPLLSQRPSIVANGDLVDIVWFDGRDGSLRDIQETEIYYTGSKDGGASFAAEQRLTTAVGVSMFPSVAMTSDRRLHVVWSDARSGQSEIYYKRLVR